ncbi:MAG TPA: cupin domain-containing protein [Candidatus Limnocylindria bacterium]|nr:cupin domain-containing protein [Candidatus Limnocylindria bacterium]
MQLVDSNRTIEVPQGTSIDYYQNNPLVVAAKWVEDARLAAELDCYQLDQIHYLFPIESLELWGPSGGDHGVLDPRFQDNKTDFQKQNLKSLTLGDAHFMRGWATINDWTGAFLRFSYEGGPDSVLSRAAGGTLGSSIRLFVKIGNAANGTFLTVPYNPLSDRYEIELWSYPGNDLRSQLDVKGVAAFDRGELVVRTDLVQGTLAELGREGKDGVAMVGFSPAHTMHPILPLSLEVAWSNADGTAWDSNGGRNYRYQFSMVCRGRNNYLGVGVSESPHGGVGFLHYRNLMSNYFGNEALKELGREVEPWMFNAIHQKPSTTSTESFFTMDYIDFHILRPGCGIGLHRHRDNQEIFYLTQGRSGLMFVGDWCLLPNRDRCLEARYMSRDTFSLVKPGGFHGLLNNTEEDMCLLMFGGYD